MDKDRMKGAAKSTGGKMKEAAGKMSGDSKMEAGLLIHIGERRPICPLLKSRAVRSAAGSPAARSCQERGAGDV